MIFPADHIRLILQGKLTQFARPRRTLRCHWRPGHTFEARSHTARPDREGHVPPAPARIMIAATHRLMLDELTEAEAVAMGHEDLDDLHAHWQERHPGGPAHPVPVWLVTFHLDCRDPVRLLHRDSTHGYTTSDRLALTREPEAVDEAVQARITLDARVRNGQLRAARRAERRQQALDERLRQAHHAARAKGIDASHRLRAIERHVAALEDQADAA